MALVHYPHMAPLWFLWSVLGAQTVGTSTAHEVSVLFSPVFGKPDESVAAPVARRGLTGKEICRFNRSDFCRSPGYSGHDCFAGTLFEACDCVDGYGAQELWEGGNAGTTEYTCCPGQRGNECFDYSARNVQILTAVGVLALISGLCGVALTSERIEGHCRKPVAAALKAEDRAIESAVAVLDGALLHRQVPMERWCVTLADLKQFRRLIQHAVREQRITPTDRDPFDPCDNMLGPCIHTVNAQYIMPVTEAAGGMSWALMLHPTGLHCDLFVTHGWAEGVYEFIDKVVNSWPAGAKHAYCCMLSNPQNLDISDLISCPKDSPFARALHSAPRMLVVPNRAGSIYTRIWCAYEAYLAYSWNKIITTASSPVPGLWRSVLRVGFGFLSGAGACLICACQAIFTREDVNLVLHILGTSTFVLALCLWQRCQHRYVVLLNAFFLGAWIYPLLLYFRSVALWLFYLLSSLLAPALEADRLWAAGAAKQTQQLQKGYTGHLSDAQCTFPADGESIRHELAESGLKESVEQALTVLIHMGMSTPTLRQAEKQAGALGDASQWGVLTLLLAFYLPMVYLAILGHGVWQVWLLGFEACLVCILLLKYLPPDCTAFAARSVSLGLLLGWLPVALRLLKYINRMHIINDETGISFGIACIGLALGLSVAGPAHVARVPLLGPILVRALLGRKPRCRQTETEQLLGRVEAHRSLSAPSSAQRADPVPAVVVGAEADV